MLSPLHASTRSHLVSTLLFELVVLSGAHRFTVLPGGVPLPPALVSAFWFRPPRAAWAVLQKWVGGMVDSRHGIKASTGRPALLIWTVVAVAGLAALVGIGTRHALQLLLLAKPPPTADPQPHVPEQATPSSLLPPGHAGCAAESEGWKWGTWEAHGCTRLQRVCVDDAAIILTDAKYQQDTPKGRRAGALPVIKVSPSKAYVYPWRSEAAPGPPHPAVAGRASQQRRAAYEVRVSAGERWLDWQLAAAVPCQRRPPLH